MIFRKKKEQSNSNEIVADKLNFATREAYNLLRTNLMFSLAASGSGNVIGITSSYPQEGKSFTAINLAYALAKDNKKVLLIEADMRKGVLNEGLKLEKTKGLSEVLLNPKEDVINKGVLHENLSVILAGAIPPNPAELLGSVAMEKLLKKCSKRYKIVLVDLPPVLSVSDPLIVSKYLSGMVVVLRHSLTRRKDLIETVKHLEFAKVNILGLIYNDFSSNDSHYYKGKKKYSKYYKKKYYSKYYKIDKSEEQSEESSTVEVANDNNEFNAEEEKMQVLSNDEKN